MVELAGVITGIKLAFTFTTALAVAVQLFDPVTVTVNVVVLAGPTEIVAVVEVLLQT